jgi:hypothetical protein
MTSYLHDAGRAEGARGIERASDAAAAAVVEAAVGMQHREAGVGDSEVASARAESSGFPCWETWRRQVASRSVRPETVRWSASERE